MDRIGGLGSQSPVGVPKEHQHFLKTHMMETDNLLEILLRLIHGECAMPFLQSVPSISAPSNSGPTILGATLAATLDQSSLIPFAICGGEGRPRPSSKSPSLSSSFFRFPFLESKEATVREKEV
jgi:hypothetical protein